MNLRVGVLMTAILGVLLHAVPLSAQAQKPPKHARVGVLMGGAPDFQSRFDALRQRLRELGYVEGQTISFVLRNAEGRPERYTELAAELVSLRPDVVVVQGNAPIAAMKAATQTIPIVMAQVADPVGAGFVASLAKPGGNVTGLSNMAEGVSAKWLELLKELAPKATRVAILREPANPAHTSMVNEIQRAARVLNMTTVTLSALGPEEIGRAFAGMGAERINGIIILPHPPALSNSRQIVELAIRQRLPTVTLSPEYAAAGFLMAYGPDILDRWRGAAEFVDRIIKGAKPGDLPVHQPTKFELVINLKTARAIGITIPPSLLTRADKVIE